MEYAICRKQKKNHLHEYYLLLKFAQKVFFVGLLQIVSIFFYISTLPKAVSYVGLLVRECVLRCAMNIGLQIIYNTPPQLESQCQQRYFFLRIL